MSEVEQLVQRTVALSQSFRKTANAVIDEAHARFNRGTLSQAEFNNVFAGYLSMVQRATDVNNAATPQLAIGVGAVLDAVEKDTATLLTKLDELDATRDLIAVVLKLLVALGAIALAVIAPSPLSAAAAGVAVADALDSVIQPRQ
jgi:hypothetical protein